MLVERIKERVLAGCEETKKLVEKIEEFKKKMGLLILIINIKP